ncbi:DUF2721 domain-containing protein [Oscillatoria sp. FACHB-1407]|uniref:DUF2721 domain-containing protein n=1 Tax=Oscillatoria sp. FACHB-1407 TaxID=2692847 RepID=UPI001688FF0B|nr:DUF2721 domain-containing protein [Oscillatoria sp. FACHB-1407]MBD2462705.1 DUF2721 domain-containing protein [Oscillatoria sp. FACHB-1407]
MSATDVAQTIQLIIAPVVLITACAITQGGILGRFIYVGQRIRSLATERLQLLHTGKMNDAFSLERLQEIDRQIPLLKHRHRLIQRAVLLIYSAIAVFLVSMFAIALSVASSLSLVATLALLLFLVGTCLLLAGVIYAGLEVRMSHQAICYEVNRVTALDKFF